MPWLVVRAYDQARPTVNSSNEDDLGLWLFVRPWHALFNRLCCYAWLASASLDRFHGGMGLDVGFDCVVAIPAEAKPEPRSKCAGDIAQAGGKAFEVNLNFRVAHASDFEAWDFSEKTRY